MAYKTLLLDIGGVLLTNGWDRHMREKAIQVFQLDPEETDKRHKLIFDTYEIGKVTLDDYLNQVVFYKNQPFSMEVFKSFMFEQSQPHKKMLDLMKGFKKEKRLKVVALSNEGRELMEHRISAFRLEELFDCFIVSSYVQMRKPDPAIYRLAMDVGCFRPEDAIYVDDRPLLVEVGQSFGLHAIAHQSYEKTKELIEAVL